MTKYNWSPEPKNNLNRPEGGPYDQRYAVQPSVAGSGVVGAAKCLLYTTVAATAIIGGAFLYHNPITEAGKARHAALQKLDNVEMIPVDIDARDWRKQARKEFKAAGIDLGKTGAEPLYKLEHIVESANDHKPWERSGEAHVPDLDNDGKFGDLPMVPYR